MNKKNQPVTAISLLGIGKKFNNRWIFNNINFNISQGDRIAITGSNGSGKSTLLQIISGYVSPSAGTILWRNDTDEIPVENIYSHLSLATPYLELIEDFTLKENAAFFCRMKPLQGNYAAADIINVAGLNEAADRNLKYFSSGMKQRVKLTLAFLADTSMLLLDEPLSNLDAAGYQWYQQMMNQFLQNRTLVVCSNNVAEETGMCTRRLEIEEFRQN